MSEKETLLVDVWCDSAELIKDALLLNIREIEDHVRGGQEKVEITLTVRQKLPHDLP